MAVLNPSSLLALQRSAGNRAVSTLIQRKVTDASSTPEDLEVLKTYKAEKKLKSLKGLTALPGKIVEPGAKGAKSAFKGLAMVHSMADSTAKLDALSSSEIGSGTSLIGDIFGVGIASKEIKNARKVAELGKASGKEHLARVGERRVLKGTGDLTKSTLGVVKTGATSTKPENTDWVRGRGVMG